MVSRLQPWGSRRTAALPLVAPPLIMRKLHYLPMILAAAIGAARCNSTATSTQPSALTPTLTAISFSATSLGVGATAQGTVRLSNSAPAAANVNLSSSNPSVIGVPAAVAIASGAATATFTATAAGPGTATVTASFNGSSQSAQIVVSGSLAIASIALRTGSVVGGNIVDATVTLTGPAPAGGATVTLSSGDPAASVPASVLIPAGAASVAFAVTTRAVGSSMVTRITGSYGGTSASADLTIAPPPTAVASFGVTGATETDTCMLINGGTALDCTFNGSTSTSPGTITAWDWTFGVTSMRSQTTSSPVFAKPPFDCSLLPTPPLPAGATSFPMTVKLIVHDDRGNVSSEAVHSDVRLLPQGACGF
jgi:hypothetical protein